MASTTSGTPAFITASGAEPVSWKRSDGSSVPGYAFGVAGSPAVIVMQEWWGMDKDILHHAQKIAEQGFRTVREAVHGYF